MGDCGVSDRARHVCARIVMEEGEDRDAFSTTTQREVTEGEDCEDDARRAAEGHVSSYPSASIAKVLFLTCAHASLSPVAPHAFDRRGR